MALKTQPTDANVDDYIAKVENEQRREDAKVLDRLCQEISGAKPVMWGEKIIGYGTFPYQYADGREMEWFPIGFRPGKNDITIYLKGHYGNKGDLLARLGKHKVEGSCLHIKKLSDLDQDVLRALIQSALD